MRYLFVVQGEGRGHFTQALSMKDMLEHNGHEVVGVMVGCSAKRTLPEFFKANIKTEIHRFQSPNFLPAPKTKKNSILASVFYNALLSPTYVASLFKIKKVIADLNPDIVLNFYELLCGLTYGFMNPGVPMINVAHQYYFLTKDFEYKGNKKIEFFLLNFYSKLTALNASKILALSFRESQSDFKQNISIVPPLLRKELFNVNIKTENFVHGYILNSAFADELLIWSNANPAVKLNFYWDKSNVKETVKLSDNLKMNRLNDKRFLVDMARSRAYATTAGFESVCEAMYLQKPVLMVPTHIEQDCNAYDAFNSGAGIFSDEFEIQKLIEFIPAYKKTNQFRYWVQSSERLFIHELTQFETQPTGLFQLF